MDIAELTEQNPWWKDKSATSKDYDIEKWESRKHKWTPHIISQIALSPGSLHIVLGPRQAGKTTAMKLLIRNILEKREPNSVFYFNCESIGDYKELIELLNTYLEFKEAGGIKHSAIFLDEISSPKEWYKGLKFMLDAGKLKNETVIITGSSSIAIKKQVELFPGRRGEGKDFLLLPLSFREFISVMEPGIAGNIQPALSLNAEELSKKALTAMIYKKELDRLLAVFKEYGGFPLSVDAIGGSREEAKRVYISWIKNAVLKAERSDIIARQVMKAAIERMPSAISWENISKEIEIKSPKTVSAYMELLKLVFAVEILYSMDISKRTVKFGKNKKIYAIDPLLIEIFEEWCLVKIKDKDGVLAETLVVTALERAFRENVFFWKNGFEIDAIVLNKNKIYGFEVKSGTETKAKSLPHLETFAVVTKDEFSKNPLKIPLSVFLAIIE